MTLIGCGPIKEIEEVTLMPSSIECVIYNQYIDGIEDTNNSVIKIGNNSLQNIEKKYYSFVSPLRYNNYIFREQE